MIGKPYEMSEIRWKSLQKELSNEINFLFVSQEVLGHAFADFRNACSKLYINTSEFEEQMANIHKSLSWFYSWYEVAFSGNADKIESIGHTGDVLKEKLKELYLNEK